MKRLRAYIGRTVIVNAECRERSFQGVLEAVDDHTLTLSDPYVLEPRKTALDGLVLVSLDALLWVQVI